ncbi:611_t:CDS:2 [Acaulospora morrowiae]|uniref:611_t:CDS:1 n=1 Tax=Acaulospora morrowiae TaxID=94023 RepID=A0A9N9GUJ0_9GLOM|nr:611_t:CDS:2 [Acaulospora morrowiae]
MTDYYAKLQVYDKLLENWHSGEKPSMSPEEHSYYRDLLLKSMSGVQLTEPVKEKKRSFWHKMYDGACSVGNFFMKYLISPIIASLSAGFLGFNITKMIGF